MRCLVRLALGGALSSGNAVQVRSARAEKAWTRKPAATGKCVAADEPAIAGWTPFRSAVSLRAADRRAAGDFVPAEPEASARGAATPDISGCVPGAGDCNPAARACLAPSGMAPAAGVRPAGDSCIFVPVAGDYAGVVSFVFCGVCGGLPVEPAIFVVPQFRVVAASGGA